MSTLKKTINGIDFYSDGRIEKNGVNCTYKNKDGYLNVCYCNKRKIAHRLIYEMFIGEIPNDLEIDHINGVRDDNRIENLEAVTHAENIKRAAKRGSYKNNRLRSGEFHGRSVVDEMIVLTLRTLPKKSKNGRGHGFSNIELSKIYGISEKRVCGIRNNLEWKHLPSAS